MPLRIFKICVAAGGWVLLFVLAWQVRSRLLFKVDSWFPQVREKSRWEQTIEAKKYNLRQIAWKDGRPLILILGDSQVEMGNWYDLFQGRFAIRNAGLSQAKIKDVARVADGISIAEPAITLLFCGINDLGGGSPVEDTLKDYFKLLDQVSYKEANQRLVVISTMPVARIRLSDGSKDLNAKVHAFNDGLQRHCKQAGITFVDVTPAVSKNGMLREELTWDGLHLNPAGYQQLADYLQPSLSQLYDKSEGK